jgi:hypothetical protein
MIRERGTYMRWKRYLVIVSLMTVTLTFLVSEGGAIPAFARRYEISCSACHAPIPKLKPYGDEFAGNGFVIPKEEKERDHVSAGDNMLWLSRTFPLAVRLDAYAVYEEDQKVESDLETPWGLKLLSGGPLFRNVGYYFYFYMSERGDVAGVEDAYIHFNDLVGRSLDVMIGQFQISGPLMKRELRLTFEDYLIYKTRVGDSQINLAYDRGIMVTYGIEGSATDLVAMIVNGNGIAAADEAAGKFDRDKYKNIGFRLSQGLGNMMSIGGFYYTGKERLESLAENGDNGDGGFEKVIVEYENRVTYWGPDISISFGSVEFTGQYLLRQDSHPVYYSDRLDASGQPDVKDKETGGAVAGLTFAPRLDKSRYYITALYNRVDSDLDGFDSETATVSATYLVARNLRLMAEYTRDIEKETSRIVIGSIAAF